MSRETLVLGPDPELDELNREQRRHWSDRRSSARRDHDSGGKWSSLTVETSPLMAFFGIVTKIAERAAARGEVGEGGGFVWSIAEWQRFIRAAREEKHPAMFGTAVFKTVKNVETMLADGKNAREIHAALFWRARQEDADRERQVEADRRHAERTLEASFETAVREKMRDERARAEARRRVKAESDADELALRRHRREPV